MIRYRTSTARPAPTARAGTAGLVAVGISVACTFAVAVAGPSVMEPALPGRPGQPPWSLGLHPSPYLAIGLTAAGLAAGALGLVLTLRAVRQGWSVPARGVLAGGLLAAAAFAAVALLLHRMTRPEPARQLRAALLWTANPLLLQVLVAGAHVDGQAVAFGVAAVAVMSPVALPATGPVTRPVTRPRARAALAGVLVGLGFAVKVTIALTGLGLALALGYGCWRRRGPWRELWPPLAALGAGFAVTAGAALAIGGSAMLRQTSQASDMVSIGSPWRVIRSVIHLAVTGTAATDIVKAGAVALAVLLAVLLIRGLEPGSAGSRAAYPVVVFALVMAWLFAWPYVLPWYDALAWALLPLVPLAPGGAAEALGWIVLARTA